MRMNHLFVLIIALLPISAVAQDKTNCATTISELKSMLSDQAFPLDWEETSMNDGKPLVVSISESHGNLFLNFIKTKEGLWAESNGIICKTDTEIETRFNREQIRLGPAANWIIRYALRKGGKFTLTMLEAKQLRIATTGWSGVFSPRLK